MCILLAIWFHLVGAGNYERVCMERGERANHGPTMSDVLEDDGSETIAVFSMFFVNHTKRYIVAVWGDDFARSMALRRGRLRAL